MFKPSNPRPTAEKEKKGYQWTKQWYPVAVEAALDPAVPHKVRRLAGHSPAAESEHSTNHASKHASTSQRSVFPFV